MPATRPPTLREAALDYAAELDNLDLSAIGEWMSEVACESPYWDEHTDLWSMAAGPEPLDAALVLSDGTDEVVIRHDGTRWIVDDTPVDWDALEEEAFEDPDDVVDR